MPVGADTFSEALQWGVDVYHALKGVLKAKGLAYHPDLVLLGATVLVLSHELWVS